MRALIADDDAASRRMFRKLLEPWGHADMTLDGIETLEAFEVASTERAPYELVILSSRMPRLDGLKALQAIRASEARRGVEPELRVKVIMTAIAEDPEFDPDAYAAWAVAGFLAKPVTRAALDDELARLGFAPERGA